MKENDNTIIVGAKGEYAEGNHFFRCIKDQYLEKYKINRDLYKLYEKSITKNPEVLGLKIEREIYRPSIWLLFVEVAEYNNSIRREIVQVGSNKNIFCALENDISKALAGIKKSENNKYNKLYSDPKVIGLSFYELNINVFLKDFKVYCENKNIWDQINNQVQNIIDLGISSLYNNYIMDNPNKLLLRGCVEGLASFMTECRNVDDNSRCMWKPSPEGIDEWFYDYFSGLILQV